MPTVRTHSQEARVLPFGLAWQDCGLDSLCLLLLLLLIILYTPA